VFNYQSSVWDTMHMLIIKNIQSIRAFERCDFLRMDVRHGSHERYDSHAVIAEELCYQYATYLDSFSVTACHPRGLQLSLGSSVWYSKSHALTLFSLLTSSAPSNYRNEHSP
jgi:hypothetical protein